MPGFEWAHEHMQRVELCENDEWHIAESERTSLGRFGSEAHFVARAAPRRHHAPLLLKGKCRHVNHARSMGGGKDTVAMITDHGIQN